jgi:SCY1-like protein 2
MAQPDLDYMAPEIQLDPGGRVCGTGFDMFSFGMVLCAIFNGGHSLIQAAHNVVNYNKQIDKVRLSLWHFGSILYCHHLI